MYCFFRLLAIVLILSCANNFALACPFCRPVKTTFTEDINAADVAVLGELVDRPKRPDSSEGELPAADIIDSYKTKFRIKKIYKGDKRVRTGDEIVAIYTGDAPVGAQCLLRGIGKEDLQWAPPVPLGQRAQAYVEQVLKLPASGADRLIFFENYLEDKDPVLQGDAFDEFARADYQALKDIRDEIDHERLLTWIKNPDVTPSNRRLYFTMLSVCGKPQDLEFLQEMIVSGDERQLKGLDSLISCYLTLAGAAGIDLIEDEFLRGGVFWDPEYVHTYAAIMAIRFQGQEEDTIPRDRLVAALRIVLDRPELADLVIPDLARWKDWASMDRLVQMFKDAGEKSSWVRVPIVNFLRACPLPQAKEQLGELAEIDPDAVRRATTFFPFATGRRGNKSEANPSTEQKKEK
ncbi:MAG: hypothetical protein CMJ74_04215 [Planctomycetaceae bacterium]|nr:hypothetical protein [Planctomycetaceae bacterium]|tara:strand:+ start:18996 stop:20213 length:1218 start_codon:yes stop_codon:yes gene_type:complete